MRPTVADRLRIDGGGVVGRDEEIRLAREVLRANGPPSILHVHGPGGWARPVSCVRWRGKQSRPGGIRCGSTARTPMVGGTASSPPSVTGTSKPFETLGDALPEKVLPWDLVMDATGRPGRAAGWFAAHGWTVPEKQVLVEGVRYSTALVRRNPEDLGGRLFALSGPRPSTPRGGAAFAQEDETWIVTLVGLASEQPPLDPEGYRAFARTIVAPEIAQLLDTRELIDAPRAYRFPHSLRRRIEKCPLPQRYAVIGDALCSFDPAFGQGMSVAAIQAVALHDALTGFANLEARLAVYHRDAVRIVKPAWSLVLSEKTSVMGPAPTKSRARIIAGYVRQARVAARTDPEVSRVLLRVAGLLDPPEVLMSPRIAARVALASARRRHLARTISHVHARATAGAPLNLDGTSGRPVP